MTQILNISILSFFLGTIIGSFISVLNYRIENNIKGIIKGRSMCTNTKCKHTLKLLDLIPVFSYLGLKGKCRYCKQQINKSYFYLEIITGILFATTMLNLYLLQEINLTKTIFFLLVFSFSVAISFYDYKTQTIPNNYSYTLIVIAILGSYLILGNSIQAILLGGILGYLFFYLQYFISKGKWTGLGDADLGAVIGIIMGPILALQSIFIAYLMGSIYGIYLIISKKASIKSRIPFGPFLLGSLFLNVIFTEQIIKLLTLNF